MTTVVRASYTHAHARAHARTYMQQRSCESVRALEVMLETQDAFNGNIKLMCILCHHSIGAFAATDDHVDVTRWHARHENAWPTSNS